jgi:hypothetical protein
MRVGAVAVLILARYAGIRVMARDAQDEPGARVVPEIVAESGPPAKLP